MKLIGRFVFYLAKLIFEIIILGLVLTYLAYQLMKFLGYA